MNNLKQDLTNKYIVVDKKVYNDKGLIFFCEGGFGCSSFTHGSKIFGYWLSDNIKDCIRGEYCIRLATDEEIKNKKVNFGIRE